MSEEKKGFVIIGKVIEKESKKGISGLIVEGWDKDTFSKDDHLGSVITDKNGYFKIKYTKMDFQEFIFDRKPDIYLKVKKANGEVICETKKEIRQEAGKMEEVIVEISKEGPEDKIKDKLEKQKATALNPNRFPIVVFSGQVVSNPRCRKPVKKALVEVAGIRTHTDKRGYFRIAVPVKDPKAQNRFVLNIRKEGFGFVSKVSNTGVQDKSWNLTKATTQIIDPTQTNLIIDTRLLNMCTGSLSSQVDWSRYEHRRTPRQVDNQGQYVGEASAEIKRAVEFAEHAGTCNGGISVSIPANSLVDSGGNPPPGKVTATISTVDIYDPDSMPGDFTAEFDDRIGYMITYGAGTISITSNNKEYQLKKGATATITIPINSTQLKHNKKLEPEIPLLIYDEEKGIWHAVGKAKLNKEQNAYVGDIDHFSAFNMDLVKTDQSCVRIDSNGIDGDYDLEISIPFGNDVILRTVSVDNTTTKLHVIYNLPSNTDIALRAFNSALVPITDTVSVNTGAPQNPSTPNSPDYPYAACNGQVVLSEQPLAPVLSGWPNIDGTIKLAWNYKFPGGLASSQDGYELEESTTSANGPWTQIHKTTNDRREIVEYTTPFKPTGDYWYRVRANKASGYTPYSNVVNIIMITGNITPNPTILRIINDLTNEGDWNLYNGIIRVRVGSSENDVLNSNEGERLYPGEETSDVEDLLTIPPGYYQDFDVSNVPTPDGGYYVFIQCGWWDPWFNPNPPYQFLYYKKHDTKILNCFNQQPEYPNKWAVIRIIPPFFEPEEIRASEWLPHIHWPGHPLCP